MDSYRSSFLFPAEVVSVSANCGSGGGEEPCGDRVSAGIETRFDSADSRLTSLLDVGLSGIVLQGHERSIQSIDEANGPIAKCVQRVCHDTLAWLISVSLGVGQSYGAFAMTMKSRLKSGELLHVTTRKEWRG